MTSSKALQNPPATLFALLSPPLSKLQLRSSIAQRWYYRKLTSISCETERFWKLFTGESRPSRPVAVTSSRYWAFVECFERPVWIWDGLTRYPFSCKNMLLKILCLMWEMIWHKMQTASSFLGMTAFLPFTYLTYCHVRNTCRSLALPSASP